MDPDVRVSKWLQGGGRNASNLNSTEWLAMPSKHCFAHRLTVHSGDVETVHSGTRTTKLI